MCLGLFMQSGLFRVQGLFWVGARALNLNPSKKTLNAKSCRGSEKKISRAKEVFAFHAHLGGLVAARVHTYNILSPVITRVFLRCSCFWFCYGYGGEMEIIVYNPTGSAQRLRGSHLTLNVSDAGLILRPFSATSPTPPTNPKST